MSDASRVTVNATPGITEEQARDARARALHFVFDCYAKKKAAHPGGPDDAEESKNARTATAIIQED
jgi:hypothetical protein